MEVRLDLEIRKNKAYKALQRGNKELLKTEPFELVLKVSNGFSKVFRVKFDPAIGTFKFI